MAKKVVYGMLLALFTGVIVFSSTRTGLDHSNAGGLIIGWINNVFFGGRLSAYEQDAIVGVGAKFLGHFCLFMGAGFFAYLFLKQFPLDKKKRYLIVFAYGLALSCLGETIQVFSEGRFATPADVLIDFSGYCFTLLLRFQARPM